MWAQEVVLRYKLGVNRHKEKAMEVVLLGKKIHCSRVHRHKPESFLHHAGSWSLCVGRAQFCPCSGESS